MGQEELQALARVLRVLADESRLRILGLLATHEHSVGELAALLSLKEPTVSHHLNKLKEHALVDMRVEGNAHLYRLNPQTLRMLNRDLLTPEQVASLSDDIASDAWERQVLRSFVEGERLKEIPSMRKKRQVILKWLLNRFEQDRTYTEAQINDIIKRHHPDSATLRREFIMNGLMQREHGVYWRVPQTTSQQGSGAGVRHPAD
jgi:DNA-binding transcriptional ArsR family regulator